MDYFTSCIIYGRSTRTPLEMQIWYLNYKIYRTTTCWWVTITRQVVSSLGKTLPEAYNLSSSGLLWCRYCVVTVFVSWASRQDMSSCQVMWRNWLGEGCVPNLSSSQELFTAELTLHKMFCGFKTLGNSQELFFLNQQFYTFIWVQLWCRTEENRLTQASDQWYRSVVFSNHVY